VLSDVATHADLIAFVERVLGTRDVLLSQSAIWAKYAGTGDFDQGLGLRVGCCRLFRYRILTGRRVGGERGFITAPPRLGV
jgi:hypothetical protein